MNLREEQEEDVKSHCNVNQIKTNQIKCARGQCRNDRMAPDSRSNVFAPWSTIWQ